MIEMCDKDGVSEGNKLVIFVLFFVCFFLLRVWKGYWKRIFYEVVKKLEKLILGNKGMFVNNLSECDVIVYGMCVWVDGWFNCIGNVLMEKLL